MTKAAQGKYAELHLKSGISLIPYKPEHMALIKPKLEQNKFLEANIDTEGFKENFLVDGLSYTIIGDNQEIVAIFGVSIVEHDRDTGFSWVVLSDSFDAVARDVTNVIKDLLDGVGNRVKKVIGSVEVGFDIGHRWAKYLGFKSTDRHFSAHGMDYLLYERTF